MTGAIAILADYSENLKHQSQDSAQRDYFEQLQTTLFICEVQVLRLITTMYQMICRYIIIGSN